MKIIVLNGSPRGEYSVTIQTTYYIQKYNSDVSFEIIPIGKKIKTLDRKQEKFDEIIEKIKVADGVIFSYPVYTFLIPYQLMRFIELVEENDVQSVFEGKYATQISTSKHFFDTTAHDYIHHISESLGMKYVPGLAADADDLLSDVGREQALGFFSRYKNAIENNQSIQRKYFQPKKSSTIKYQSPLNITKKLAYDKKVVIVTDTMDQSSNVTQMIQTYKNTLPNPVKIVNLKEFPFLGGCRGCFKCATDGTCIYGDKFDEFHIEVMQGADCLIYAAEIGKHHWFDSVWKCFSDRQFYNGHRMSQTGTLLGYLISGDLKHEPVLRTTIEARAEVGEFFLLDIITDEAQSNEELTDLIETMAQKTIDGFETQPSRPQNFYGTGGMKIFRDLIYVMRGLMRDDHKFYKKHGVYKTLPQRHWKRIIQVYFLSIIVRMIDSTKLKKKYGNLMDEGMIMPYKKVIDKE